MSVWRQLPGYLLAMVLLGVGVLLLYLGWLGWSREFGWQWALVALSLSAFARLNVFTIVGAFFYAQHHLGWTETQSIALSCAGLLYLTPEIVGHTLEFFTGSGWRR